MSVLAVKLFYIASDCTSCQRLYWNGYHLIIANLIVVCRIVLDNSVCVPFLWVLASLIISDCSLALQFSLWLFHGSYDCRNVAKLPRLTDLLPMLMENCLDRAERTTRPHGQAGRKCFVTGLVWNRNSETQRSWLPLISASTCTPTGIRLPRSFIFIISTDWI